MFILLELGYTNSSKEYNIEGVRTMGYLLPIRPIQSEQYANRINMERYNFASVDRLYPVKLRSDFLEEFEEKLYLLDEQKGREKAELVSSPQSYQGYISPNPANLSPAISQVVGKGISVNMYI